MIPKYIKIAGITNKNRNNMIDYTVNSIISCSGWVTSHTMFTNEAICINFEIEAKGINKLLKLLNSNGLNLSKESIDIAKMFPENVSDTYMSNEIMGALNIIFIPENLTN